jgi:hypothetical protein
MIFNIQTGVMEDASKLDDLSKAINSFIDEYEYYLFSDHN